MSRLVIGTRGSALALWQSEHVRAALLAEHPDLEISLQVIRTKGDKILDSTLSKIGDKGLFTKEIENALLDKTIDLAVHSLKDLPTELQEDLAIAAVTTREDPADVLVAKEGLKLESLTAGAKVLTGSLRRQAQLLHRRSDLLIEPVRGNIQTRLKKLDESEAQAIVLAKAGLVRLGLSDRITERLDPAEFLPACGQGALAVEIRKDNSRLAELLRPLDNLKSRATTTAERTFLAELGGGCQVPAGAYARISGEPEVIAINAMVANLDGSQLLRDSISAPVTGLDSAVELGRKVAERLRAKGCQKILDEVLAESPPIPEHRQ